MRTRHHLLGLPVDATGFQDVEESSSQAVKTRSPLRIVVTNANKAYLATHDPALREVLEESDLIVSESSMVWGCRMMGISGVTDVWGVVLMERLLRLADRGGWSVFLLGARPEVLELLVNRLRREFPGLRLVGARDGYFSSDEEDRLRRGILAASPDLLLVAMGSPRQERFIASLGRDPNVRVTLGVGGSFDIHSGVVADVPARIRGSGFEWLWRSFRNPRLLRRYLVINPWFVGWVLMEKLFGKTPAQRKRAREEEDR